MENERSYFEKESQSENMPTREEVLAVFARVIKGEYKEVQACEDEKGLYLLEVEVPGELENETTEYAYRRQGNYKEFSTRSTVIQVVHYKDGIPVGGTTVADYDDGEWKIIVEVVFVRTKNPD